MFTQAISLCFTATAILSVGDCSVLPRAPPPGPAGPGGAPCASIQQGQVIGTRDASGNSVFLGVPFAATTGGKNRYVSQ